MASASGADSLSVASGLAVKRGCAAGGDRLPELRLAWSFSKGRPGQAKDSDGVDADFDSNCARGARASWTTSLAPRAGWPRQSETSAWSLNAATIGTFSVSVATATYH